MDSTAPAAEASSSNDAPSKPPNAPSAVSIPAISTPKGGGAIRGIDEKFATNAATGSGTFAVPIDISPARSGFHPQLSLKYSSGGGNSPFGLGWDLGLPSIRRKTAKGLPRYDDAAQSDTFILSDAEDLVPQFRRDVQGNLLRTASGSFVLDEIVRDEYIVRKYAPRIESAFTRIERWTRRTDGDTYWRTISAENMTTLYGTDEQSRISGPGMSSVFAWLVRYSYDDKGNAILYEYKTENSQNVDTGQANEFNRTAETRAVNKYVSSIKYGNRKPNRDLRTWQAVDAASIPADSWMFEVVFDYGEHDPDRPAPGDTLPWPCRPDPFSSYLSGFEIRAYRRCKRILIFHHFPDELGILNYMVRSLDIRYEETSTLSVVTRIDSSGYVLKGTGAGSEYLKKTLSPVDLYYSKPPDASQLASLSIQDLDPDSLENLPSGIDNSVYQWVDLDGEGISGILTGQQGGWYYKRNTSSNNTIEVGGVKRVAARFSPLENVPSHPPVDINGNGVQLIDLAGDGQIDCVVMDEPVQGFYERTQDGKWDSFRTFEKAPSISTKDPNIRMIDLTGDGFADILVTDSEVLTCYLSEGEAGFGEPYWLRQSLDDEKGPKFVFSDLEQSIYLADMSGDGLTDLVRICHSGVSYLPNLGYGRFGSRVYMDNAPRLERHDIFNSERVHLADIDGSGTSDILYFGNDGVDIYLNQSGNSYSPQIRLEALHCSDTDLTDVSVVDILGNGTACIAISSPLPADARKPLRYINLMPDGKPHLLVRTVNNLGAETRIRYAPSTQYYLEDKANGTPWLTRLPFPVHCVERVETYDWISKSRFTSRYAYHHGFFDGLEREFHGFGMVEEWDTEEIGTLSAGTDVLFSEAATNQDEAFWMPPTHTKSWYHTGSSFDSGNLARHLAKEYFPLGPGQGWSSAISYEGGLTAYEEREAFRSLKGSLLRLELYTDDTDSYLSSMPYSVTQCSFTVHPIQPQGGNKHAVFLTHAREKLTYHCDRTPDDTRIQHDMVLQTDRFGHILKSLSITYGRLKSDLDPRDKNAQQRVYITLAETDVTNWIDDTDDYRLPVEFEVREWELTGLVVEPTTGLYSISKISQDDFAALDELIEIPFEQVSDPELKQKRLLGRARTVYRNDDLSTDLPLGRVGKLGLAAESHTLTFTSGLLKKAYQRGSGQDLLGNYTSYIGSKDQGAYVELERDGSWWCPSGRLHFHTDEAANAQQELIEARAHFFLPRRFTNQFGHISRVVYDTVDLLPLSSSDSLGNSMSAINDYRILSPRLVTDPNGNQIENVYDALGLLAGSAVMGKPDEGLGDKVDSDFKADLTQEEIDLFFSDPKGPSALILLGNATTRTIYDNTRYFRHSTSSAAAPTVAKPAFAATISRENHLNDVANTGKFQVTFAYSDGFGRILQQKGQAEPGIVGNNTAVVSRWSATGWTVFDNKGNAVKQFEPFFSDTHDFTPETEVGVSSTTFYDPLGRNVAILHPDHSWEKVIFTPWSSVRYDPNDTIDVSDPRTDPHVGAYFKRLPTQEILPSWADSRKDGQLGPDAKRAAETALAHANTPSTVHFDSLGRTFLTISDNGAKGKYVSRVSIDIEGNRWEVTDAKGRVLTRIVHDMIGRSMTEITMDAGQRWLLRNSVGDPLLIWDSRNQVSRNEYDALRRGTRSFVSEDGGAHILVSEKVYGESLPNPEAGNHRGQLYQTMDQAGVAINVRFDFKGNPVESNRQLWSVYRSPKIDIGSHPVLEERLYTTTTIYDALSRVVEVTCPDGSKIENNFNEAGLLERVKGYIHQPNGDRVWKDFVSNISYDAKGQRTLVEQGNGSQCAYTYDPLTYRLTRMRLSNDNKTHQDLRYTYDPVGNVTTISDKALQTIYFRNKIVDPSTEYTYDAMYRLLSASGREHLGQTNGRPNAPTPPSDSSGSFQTRQLHPGDGNAMGRYLEEYLYDEVGNILSMKHGSADAGSGSWTRTYVYNENSALDERQKSNRLSSTSVGGVTERYTYDTHGNMTKMPHLPGMSWNYRDQLQATTKQIMNNGTAETTYYVYNENGQRVRKVTERAAAPGEEPTRMSERVYIGELFELYREFGGSGSDLTPNLERETLHMMDDKERIAVVETRTLGSDPSPEQTIRYSHGNHLGSVSLELGDTGQVISYEEYYPYGGSSYHAARSQTDVPNRYRYAGKERDEENGFDYYGARYYASWLGRWISCDPGGLTDGTNMFEYVRSNPVGMRDQTGGFSIVPDFVQEKFKEAIDYAHSEINGFLGEVETDSVIGNVALGVAQAGVDLVAGTATMVAAPDIAGKELGEGLAKAYKDNGGGLDGILAAVNELNPAYHAMVNIYEASEAIDRGDYREAGRRGTHGGINIVATVGVATSGANFLVGGAEGAAASEASTMAESQAAKMGRAGQSAPKPKAAPEALPAPKPKPAAAPEPPPAPPKAPTAAEPPAASGAAAESTTASKAASPKGPAQPGEFDLNRPFSEWHPQDLDRYVPSSAIKKVGKDPVAPKEGTSYDGITGSHRASGRSLEQRIQTDPATARAYGYQPGTKIQTQVGHRNGPFYSKKAGDPVRLGHEPVELNNAKSKFEKQNAARDRAAGKHVRTRKPKKKSGKKGKK